MIVFLWVSGVCASPGDSINPETRKWKEIQGNTDTEIRRDGCKGGDLAPKGA